MQYANRYYYKSMKRKNSIWTPEAKKLIFDLHSQLMINEGNWHKFKSNKYRRAAELLAGALSQIVNNGKEKDIEALIEQSLLWIREEIKDPGCPSH